jgi:uncharacterized protein (DUF697 family)
MLNCFFSQKHEDRMKVRTLALAATVAATFATTAVTMAGVATAATAAATVTTGRGFTVEDLVTMERVGTPAVSPDATRVVYTVRSTDMAKNKGHTDLYGRPARRQRRSRSA